MLHVRRVKNGTPSTHPIQGDELRALRRLQRGSPTSPFVFVSERGSPFTAAGFARMIERAAAAAGLELKVHPHMLRHACGYAPRQPGPRYPGDPGIVEPSVDYQHGGLHGAGAEPVQGLLERVIRYALHCPSGHGQSSAPVLNLSSTSPRSSAVQKRAIASAGGKDGSDIRRGNHSFCSRRTDGPFSI
jgi:hypothetical protein